MLRKVKNGIREAKVRVKASRTDVARDVAYEDVPVRIDLDVGTVGGDHRASSPRGASTSSASSASSSASVRLVAHYGVDHTASTVSYADEQRVILVSTAHGVSALGGEGLECLYAVSRAGASEGRCGRYARGAARVYRCGADGDVDVWDARDQRALASGFVDGGFGDAASGGFGGGALECVRGTNFWLAGRADGSVCVYALGVNARGETTVARRSGYEVSATRALSRVTETKPSAVVAVRTRPGRDECALAMIAWEDGSLAVWHLHEKRSVAVTAPKSTRATRDVKDAASQGDVDVDVDEEVEVDAVSLTCAEWLDANTIVTGHSDGSVKLWRVRVGASNAEEIIETQRLTPHASVDASHRGALAKIRAVKTYVDDDDNDERDAATWLTCVGGEPVGCPDNVICLRAMRIDGAFRIETVGAAVLPWFGPVLDATPVPIRGVIESVCVLSEGSQLHVHDVRYGVSRDDAMPPKEVTVIRHKLAVECAPSACAAATDAAKTFAANAERLTTIAPSETDASVGWNNNRWPVSGGRGVSFDGVAATHARIIVSAFGGDESGVRVFLDVCGRLLPGGFLATNGDAITRLHVDAGGALLVVGRRSGVVEIYTLRPFPSNDGDASVGERVFVRELNAEESVVAAEERAFHETPPHPSSSTSATSATSVYTLIGTYTSPAHANNHISCLRTNAAATLLAVGDAAGNVSLIHLQQGAVAWTAAAPETERGVAAIADVNFGLPLPDFPDEDVLAVLESNANVRFHALSSGDQLGRTMIPKTPSEALSISLHRLSGAPADVVPPEVVAKSWFTPPTSFAYKFLASEFEVDDYEELDVDAEDKILSTDEEEPESDNDANGQRSGDPKLTAIVITVTVDALRAYHAVGCSRGERFTLRKTHLDEPLRHAFVAREDEDGEAFGHGRTTSRIAAVTAHGRVVTYAVPSLRAIGAYGPVPAVSNADAAGGSRGGCVVVVANDGHSLARFETYGDTHPAHGCVIDREVESAAEAARAARVAMEENDTELARETSPRRDAATPTAMSKALGIGEQLRERAKTAFEKLSSPKTVETSSSVAAPSPYAARRAYTTTDVALLFAETRIEDPPPAPTRAAATDESNERAQLFGAMSHANASSSVVPERRSAASVRAKYGRPEASAAADAALRLHETRDMLVERGERLSTLQDKSAALEADAANFADLARQIRKESERRWF